MFCHNAIVSLCHSAPAGLSWALCCCVCSASLGLRQDTGPQSHLVSPIIAPALRTTCLLEALWPGTPEQKGGETLQRPATMVPRLTLRGKALVVYEPQRVKQTTPTLEAVFDLTPGVQREIAETPFSQDTRGIVLSPHVLATVAHALTPNSVEVSVAHQTKAQKAPMPVTNMTLVARTAPGKDGVPAQVAHVNTPYDLALAQAETVRAAYSRCPIPPSCPAAQETPRSLWGGCKPGIVS